MEFVETIIRYMSNNGSVTSRALYKEYPFTRLNDQGLLGVFKKDADQDKIISIVKFITNNAIA